MDVSGALGVVNQETWPACVLVREKRSLVTRPPFTPALPSPALYLPLGSVRELVPLPPRRHGRSPSPHLLRAWHLAMRMPESTWTRAAVGAPTPQAAHAPHTPLTPCTVLARASSTG